MTADIGTISMVGAAGWVIGNGTPWLIDKTFGPLVEDRLGGLFRSSEHRQPLAERLIRELHQIEDEAARLIALLEKTIDERDHLQHQLTRCKRQFAELRKAAKPAGSAKAKPRSSRRGKADTPRLSAKGRRPQR